MIIKVEFTDPNTGEDHEIIMEGPEMDPDELREIVLEAISSMPDMGVIPEGFDLKITELVSGTIH